MSFNPPMHADLMRIPVHTHRQAMDWSLVLASQGIEGVIIEQAENYGGWGLMVEAKDYTRALKALRQYQVENRGWPWRQSLPRSTMHFDWGSAAWVFLLALFYWVSSV